MPKFSLAFKTAAHIIERNLERRDEGGENLT
jgi:hypothetical protein